MPLLRRVDGSGEDWIDNEDLPSVAAAGTHVIPEGQLVRTTDTLGLGATSAVSLDVHGRISRREPDAVGLQSQEDVNREQRSIDLEGETSTLGALARGVGSGLTFGLSDRLFSEDTIEADRLHHGTARFIGELGSFVVPGVGLVRGAGTAAKVARGAKAADTAADATKLSRVARAERTAAGIVEPIRKAASYTPLGGAQAAGRAAASRLIKGEGRLANVGRAATSAAVEGMAIGSGRELVRQATDDVDGLDAESIIGEGLLGGAIGGGLGAAGGAFAEGIGALSAARQASKAAKEVRKVAYSSKPSAPTSQLQLPGIQGPAPSMARATDAESGIVGSIKGLFKDNPGGRRVGSGISKQGAFSTALLLDSVLENGLGGVIGMAAPVAGAVVAGKTVHAAFRDPVRGGLMAAHGSEVLRSYRATPNDSPEREPPHRDIRREAVRFADRVRRVTPQQAALAASQALPIGTSPMTVAKVQETAARRQEEVLRAVDRHVPAPRSAAGHIMGPRLPSTQSARQVVEVVRVASQPTAFVQLAAAGRLSPNGLALAERLWPHHVASVRTRLMEWLERGPSMSPAERRNVELLLGRGLLDDSDGRRAAYLAAMQASHERARVRLQPAEGPRPSVTGASGDQPLDPASLAANPGSKR